MKNKLVEDKGVKVPPTPGTLYYKKVQGADIRGNIYGGGNNAEVTGDTNVVIGRKADWSKQSDYSCHH